MENYNRVLELSAKSTEMAGQADAKYAIYMESIEAKLNQLSTAWTSFVNNLSENSSIKAFVDLGTNLVNILDLLLNKFGLLKNVAFPVAIIAGLSKAVKEGDKALKWLTSLYDGFQKANKSALSFGNTIEGSLEGAKNLGEKLKGLTEGQKTLIVASQNLSKEQQILALTTSGVSEEDAKAIVQTKLLSVTQNQTATSTNVLKTALSNLWQTMISNPIGIIVAAITLLVTAFTKSEQKYQDLIQKGKDLRDNFAEIKSQINDTIGTLEDSADEFNRLSTGIDRYGRNIGLSADEYERYKEIVGQIVELNPSLAKGYSEETGYILKKNEAIEDTIRLLKEQKMAELDSKLTTDNLSKMMLEFADSMGKAKNNIKDFDTLGMDFSKFDFVNQFQKAFSSSNKMFGSGDLMKKIAESLGVDASGYSTLAGFLADYEDLILQNLDKIKSDLEAYNMPGALTTGYKIDIDEDAFSGLEDYARKMSEYQSQMDSASKGAQSVLQNIIDYQSLANDLSKEQTDILNDVLSSVNIEDITKTGFAENDWWGASLGIFGKKEIIDKDAVIDIKQRYEALAQDLTKTIEGSNKTVNEALQDLGNVDISLNTNQYEKTMRNMIDDIVSVISDEEFREQIKMNLLVQYGIEYETPDGTMANSAEEAANTMANHFKLITADKLRGLSQEEFEVAVKVYADMSEDSTFDELLDRIRKKIEEVSITATDMSSVMVNFGDEIDKVYNSFDIFDQVLAEFNEYGKISADTFNKLTDNNLIQYLEWTNNGLVVNTEALLNSETAAKNKALADLDMAYAENVAKVALEEENEAVEDGNTANTQYTGTLGAVTTALRNVRDEALNTSQAVNLVNAALAAQGIAIDNNSGKADKIKQLTESYTTMRNMIINTTRVAKDSSLKSPFGGVASSAKTAASATKELNNQLKETEQLLKNQQNEINNLLEMTMKMIRQRKEDEKAALEEEQKALKERYDAEKEYMDELKDAHDKAYDEERDRLEELKDLENERYKERKEQLEDERDRILENIDAEIDGLEKQKEIYTDKINAEKDLLRLKEDERKYDKELAEKRDDVAKIQAQIDALSMDNSMSAQKKKLELAQQLAEKQDALNEFQHEHGLELAEDALDEELKRYTEQKDAEIAKLEEESEAQKKLYEERLEQLEDAHNQYVKDVENRLKLLEKENKAWNEAHQAELKRMEEQYNAHNQMLQKQIDDIAEYLSKEVNLRNDAIDMIENRYEGFYDDLIAWNREYGTSVDADVTNAWNLAYASLEEFAGPDGCIKVQKSLETIANQMYALDERTQEVANKFKNAAWYIQNATDELAAYNSQLARRNSLEAQGGGYGGGSGWDSDYGSSYNSSSSSSRPNINNYENNWASSVDEFINDFLDANGFSSISDALGYHGDSLAIKQDMERNFRNSATKIFNQNKKNKMDYDDFLASVEYDGSSLVINTDLQRAFGVKRSHIGELYVKKIESPLDSILGVGEDETLRILKVGESVIPPVSNTSNIRGINDNLVNRSDSMSNSSRSIPISGNDDNIDVSIGDIIVQGNATQEAIDALRKERENLVKSVFDKIGQHTKRAAYNNLKTTVL